MSITIDQLKSEAAAVMIAERGKYASGSFVIGGEDTFAVWLRKTGTDICRQSSQADCLQWIERKAMDVLFAFLAGEVVNCRELDDCYVDNPSGSGEALEAIGMLKKLAGESV